MTARVQVADRAGQSPRMLDGRPSMAAQRMVLGIFADEAAADAAADALLAWVKKEDVVRRPVGVLVLGDDGQIKEHKLGAGRDGKKGAGIGLVLAVIAPPTLLAG